MAPTRVPAGRASLVALRDAVVAAKGGDPLAPVTVAVPSSYSGLSLRRLLASGDIGRGSIGGRGLVNVRFMVAARVAELLGAPALAAQGRRPMSRSVRAEAVRAALSADPGTFRSVADHPATERALDRLFVELRPCDDATLHRLAAQSRRAANLVRLYRATRMLLHDWYDEHDLAVAATRAIAEGSPAIADLGHLIAFRTELSGGSGAPLDVTAALVAALGHHATEIIAELDACSAVTSMISVPDVDEEARTIARELVARVRAGVPLHRMAVAYPAGHTYAVVLEQHLAAAGVARNGPAVRTLAHTAAGTALLGMLDLAEHGLRREALIGWLTGTPVIDPVDGRPVMASAWDTESRLAGVVGGLAQWDDRLDRHAEALERAHRDLADGSDADATTVAGRFARVEGRIASVGHLRRFIADLAGALDCSGLDSWTELARWARTVLEAYLGRASTHRSWPEDEQRAWVSVLEMLDRMPVLDGFGARPDLPAFRRTVERELEAPAGRAGAFGDGVFVAPLDLMTGVDVDVLFVAGMVEGLVPGAHRQDALLPDPERASAGGPLSTGSRGIDDQRRVYESALAAATSERVLLAPRADLGRNREYLPSRWLLAAAAELAGSDDLVSGDELPGLADGVPSIRFIASFLGGSTTAAEPASEQDRDLAALARWTAGGYSADAHHLARSDRRLRAGLRAEAERSSDRFTPYDGRVTAVSIGVPATETALSPTSLERYATCPRKYLFTRLGVDAVDRPEEVMALSGAERGTAVHAILQDYIEQVLTGAPRTLERLLDIAARHLDELERSGSTGRPLRWRYDRELIERELRRFHTEDVLKPLAAELQFGFGTEPAVELAMDTGTLRFRGIIDRVDETPDGGLLVTDYKTGRPDDFTGLAVDPVARGTKLQLPIYALAARNRFGGGGDRPVAARYWFVSERGGFRELVVPLDDATLARFTDAVTVAVEGIASGSFPARPGEPIAWPVDGWANCTYCAFDRLCPTDRGRHWERKRSAPQLARYRALAEEEAR